MKRLAGILMCFLLLFSAVGCRAEEKDDTKLRDLEFTVLEKDEIPKEMASSIEDRKKEPFQITYGDGEFLYIGQGYGEQQSSGYSVAVDRCYEGEHAIYIHTTLLGPGSGQEISENPTCPYVVVRLAWNEKYVIFQSK